MIITYGQISVFTDNSSIRLPLSKKGKLLPNQCLKTPEPGGLPPLPEWMSVQTETAAPANTVIVNGSINICCFGVN